MKNIKRLAKNIEEELSDAGKYAKQAMECKTEHPEDAALYIELAQDEMEHAERLHTQAVAAIKKYREQKGDPPERMQGRYDEMHERYIDQAAAVRATIILFKEM